jgi:hypothetical protein
MWQFIVGAPTTDHEHRVSFIPYPFALILFKGETRARLFAFFPLSALIIHPLS